MITFGIKRSSKILSTLSNVNNIRFSTRRLDCTITSLGERENLLEHEI